MKMFFLIGCAILLTGNSEPEKVEFTFDKRPQSGIPVAAELQSLDLGKRDSVEPKLWGELFADKIETANIRYFDAETWKTEGDVGEYLQGFLNRKDMKVFDFPVWSQGVGIPEIECTVQFTEEYRNESKCKFRSGKVLIWKTVACFRDGHGTWHFLSNFEHFHLNHPAADEKLKAALKENETDDE